MTSKLATVFPVLRKFYAEKSGGITILFSLSVAAVIFCAGMGIDYGRAVSLRTHIQLTLDSAVLAGVAGSLDAEALSGVDGEESDDRKIEVAKQFFQPNLPKGAEIGTPTFEFNDKILTGRVDATINMMLTKVFGINHLAISVKSRATATSLYRPLCFLAMHPSRKHTLELKQSVSVIGPDCHIYGNSDHYDDVVDPHTPHNYLVGKSVQAIGFGHHVLENVTPPLEHAPELIPDPLADMMIPSAGPCDYTKKEVDGETTTLNPGTYCKGLTIKSGANVTFNPGVYIIAGDKFKVDDSMINGNEVTIVLADDKVEIEWENSQIRLSAPVTGEYASMVLIGVRQETEHEFIDSTIDLHGIVYLINGEIDWTNDGTPNITSKWTAWIVDGVSWRGNGTVHINFDPEDSHIPYPSELNIIPRPGTPRLLS